MFTFYYSPYQLQNKLSWGGGGWVVMENSEPNEGGRLKKEVDLVSKSDEGIKVIKENETSVEGVEDENVELM